MVPPTSAPVSPPPRRPRDDGQGSREGSKPKALEVLPLAEPWHVCVWKQLNGNEGAGLALSFVIHALLLALLAIPVIRHLQNDTGFTTVVQEASDDLMVFDAPVDTQIPLPAVESAGGEEWQSRLLDPITEQAPVIPDLQLSDSNSTAGQAVAASTGNDAGGIRIADPKTAIKAGNFSVWTWPIVAAPARGRTVHGKPGDAPKALQDYHIVIRVKMPEGKRTVSLSDFSGMVVGTDGYRQKIPEDAWYFTSNGDLVRARTGRNLPVINGTAELLIRVPGAASAFIKDAIRVHSRTLNEEQTVELVFQSRD